MMVAACGQSSPVSEDAAGNGGDGSNPSGSLVSSQNTFLSIVPPGSNGNSAGGIGAPVPGVPTLSYPKNFSDQLTMYGDLSYDKSPMKSDNCQPPKNIGEHQTAQDKARKYFNRADLTSRKR